MPAPRKHLAASKPFRVAAARSSLQIADAAVDRAYKSVPLALRQPLLSLRSLILETAANTPGVGSLTETLKWNEPAYLPAQTKIGTTIRINAKKGSVSKYAMYFNCNTGLIDSFRGLFPDTFSFHGDREIEFDTGDALPIDELRTCIAMALTYHLHKRRPRTQRKGRTK